MNRTYEEWLKYYENATKEQVIEDMMLDIKELKQLKENYGRIYNENCKLREEHNITDISLLDENYKLKKQKDDVVEYIKKWGEEPDADMYIRIKEYKEFKDLLRMLGEIDE